MSEEKDIAREHAADHVVLVKHADLDTDKGRHTAHGCELDNSQVARSTCRGRLDRVITYVVGKETS